MKKLLPRLVRDDPWLEPFSHSITRRSSRLENELSSILETPTSLPHYANLHKQWGFHRNKKTQEWQVVEWAPHAQSLHLIGDFNHWNPQSHALHKNDEGLWTITLPADSLAHLQRVKLHIQGADDSQLDRIPSTIQRVVQDPDTYDFAGQIWEPPTPYMWKNQRPTISPAPLIYEAHIGIAGEEGCIHSYRAFADHILPRIAQLGYNTLQLMAIAEHPYYGSFGYHVSSFFAPSSRFGTPDDLRYLIDTAHGMGIAVLMDIVHSHAVKNLSEGLNRFDGTDYQYFHGGNKGNHPQWDSKCFDYGKSTVRRFLLSNITYWLEEFRFDGFRFDGITSMLYTHHGTIDFSHYGTYFDEGVDEDAILYLGLATTLARTILPQCILVAEDMSGMPGLCRPTSEGGMGFTHRLAMGIPDYWIKLLKHQKDEDWNPQEMWHTLENRRFKEKTIAYAESHDQALVGDKTIAFRLMDADMYWHMNKEDTSLSIERGIALHKMIRLFTLVTGGEGWLNFMGNEFGHPEWLDFPREGNSWSYHYCRRQWNLVDNPDLKYHFLNDFDREMLTLATHYGILSSPKAHLVSVHNANQVIAIQRANLLFIFNWNPHQSFVDYHIHPLEPATYSLLLNSDASHLGGHGRLDSRVFYPMQSHGNISLYIPSRCAFVLQKVETT